MSEQERDVLEGLEGYMPGPWCVWDGWEYEMGGRDLCIGAGEEWLANMNARRPCCGSPHIATLDPGEITREQEANARLIARAPELVEEVKRLRARVAELEVDDE